MLPHLFLWYTRVVFEPCKKWFFSSNLKRKENMDIFWGTYQGILVIPGVILVGFVIGEKAGLMTSHVAYSLNWSLSCSSLYMLYTITQRFTAANLLIMLPALRFPALSMVILLGIATAVARIFAVRQDCRGLFISMFLIPIRFLWGSPSTRPFSGMPAFPYVLIYYMCNTTFFWTLGPIWFNEMVREKRSLISKRVWRSLFSAPDGLSLGASHGWCCDQLPAFLASDLQYLGNLTTPLSMIFIGLSVSHVGVKQLVLEKISYWFY